MEMLTKMISLLMFLLGIVGTTGFYYGNCDYLLKIEPGKMIPIVSPNYPNDYRRGTHCRWTAKSTRPIHMHCNVFDVTETAGCIADVVLIQTGRGSGLKYCGNGKLNLISEGNQITISLNSSAHHRGGGKFSCTLRAIEKEKNECNCGWKNSARIVRGKETGINEYPMMAGIIDIVDRIISCGATIINNRQVLTAAHCIIGFKNPKLTMGVLVGEHDPTKGYETDATQLLKTQSVLIHPKFSSHGSDYDIGIVTVVGAIKISQKVGPACLPFQHAQDTFAGSPVDILGWGTIGTSLARSDVLRRTDVSVITTRACQKQWASVTSRQICTLGLKKDACQFDSGGPVLWKNPTTKRIVLVGIIDYGSICADGKPAVNTRIGPFMPWIQANSPKGYQYCQEE